MFVCVFSFFFSLSFLQLKQIEVSPNCHQSHKDRFYSNKTIFMGTLASRAFSIHVSRWVLILLTAGAQMANG